MNYTRLHNESEDELIYRIGGLKDEIGTQQDVADILNEMLGYGYTESAYRKKYQTFEKMLDANAKKFSTAEAQANAIREERDALRKERMKLQTLNMERNRIDRAEARQELYYEYIGQYVKSLPTPERYEPCKLIGTQSNIEYLLTISDIHYGATFSTQTNEYSPEICRERFNRLFLETIEFIQTNKVKYFHVLSLGDDIQGLIHMSDLRLNDTSIVKSIVEVSRLIADFLNQLSSYAHIDYYHVPTANHTQLRILGMKPSEASEEDVEFIISQYIKDLLKDNKMVDIHFGDEGSQFLFFDINGTTIAATHGHTLHDVNTAFDKVANYTDGITDVLITGHFHGMKNISVGERAGYDKEIIVCPSIIGSDPYADKLMVGSKAAAQILGFEWNKGHIETKKILLND